MDPLSRRVAELFLARGPTGPWKGLETRREREEAVTVNLPPHLQSLWHKTRAQFHGTPQQRLEQFLQYVHDHEGEEMSAVQEEADAKLERMIRDYERRPAPKHYPSYSDVPFA